MNNITDFLTGADIDRSHKRKMALIEEIKASAKRSDAEIANLRTDLSRLQGLVEEAREALFPEAVKRSEGALSGFYVSSDASLNLQGVLADIERDPNSAVNQRTIQRVIDQLEAARALLNKIGETV